ncbi:hypothetical protein BMS3Abin07_02548 [bacterium BMS3Abin07]|nr:hypothetical protein BMS3Abin07_02548 [bacterium BMS3Abin07]HDZ87372.1 hypothetical protein [Nitrospirota bacterium]
MYNLYIRRKIVLYLVTGIICSILIGANITVIKYNTALSEMMVEMKIIEVRRLQIERDVKEMNSRIRQIDRMMPVLHDKSTGRGFLLRAADDIRNRFAGDKLILTDMRGGITRVSLPVQIKFDFDSYYKLLKRFDYLEGETFPFFRFRTFSFVRSPSGKATCLIKGELVMPAGGSVR